MCKQSSFLYSLGGVLIQLCSSHQYNLINILYFYIIRISEIQDRKIAELALNNNHSLTEIQNLI